MRDMASKGRGKYPDNRGERNGGAKLTEAKVREIRRLSKTTPLSCTQLGKMFNISRATINLVQLGKIWAHIE